MYFRGEYYMKKTLAIALALLMCLSVFANGSSETSSASTSEAKATKIGFVVINDESDQGYTMNFMNGMNAALEQLKAEGYNVELLVKRNTTESSLAKDNNDELAAEGCEIIFNNSYGFEPYMLESAKENPDTIYVGMTNCASQQDDNPNTYNAFAAIYEGRYLAGIAAGMKLQQMIDEGKITADQAVVGYVGAYSFAEVISGMSGYFLGVRSVCPSATMKVYFVGTWGDATLEEAAANALIDAGCVMISQHSDTTSPALAAQKAGVYHTGYNTDMTKVAPEASLLSCRIDWTRYFYTFIKNYIDGVENPSDWTGTVAEGDVVITELNEAIAAPGTKEALEKAEKAFADGTLNVFDISTFTVNGGQTLTHAYAIDSDGDFTADKDEAVWDGVFHESYPAFQSAPYLTAVIDGITWLNAAY
jgi:basic membrane protein A and related proteins